MTYGDRMRITGRESERPGGGAQQEHGWDVGVRRGRGEKSVGLILRKDNTAGRSEGNPRKNGKRGGLKSLRGNLKGRKTGQEKS